ncbi:MAG: hypothetical protein CL842_12315 [Crocinitomicaceae bacterium]|nr:hypothetical protein [Crocinitomicaceae bacterium]|tara:strand:- start:2100 stop:3377 length:1278 start_codon:yes stop_codon:yes gene_type:complete
MKYNTLKKTDVSWVENIPSHWESTKLKYVCDISKNSISTKEFEDIELIHYSIPNVQKNGEGIKESGNDIDSSKQLLFGGEVLLSKLNPRKSTVCIVKKNDEMIVGSGEFLTFKPKNVNTKFIYYFFKNPRFTEFLDSCVKSVTRSHQRVKPDIVYNSWIYLPPQREQELIVNYLNKKINGIDTLIKFKEDKIGLLRENLNSTIYNSVTKGVRVGRRFIKVDSSFIESIPESWVLKRNKYFTIPRKNKSENGSEELLSVSEYEGVIPRKSIREGEEHLSRSESLIGYLKVNKGDLVNNIMLMWKRGLGVSDYEGIVSPSYSVFSFKNSIPMYFHYLFRTDLYTSEFRKHSTGVIDSRLRLYDDVFGSLKSHFPPIEEQIEIVEFIENFKKETESLIDIEQKKIDKLLEYKESLISNVVSGVKKIFT